MATVFQTDYAWPDVQVEKLIIEGAGHEFIAGPSEALPSEKIESLVGEYNPSAIMTCWAEISDTSINLPSDLSIVQRIGVGLDNIDVAAATARGARVCNVPDYCVEEVSDHAIALIMSWVRGVVLFDREIKNAKWDPTIAKLRRSNKLTVGILGLGQIGRVTARKLSSIGIKVLAHDNGEDIRTNDASLVGLNELLAKSDVVLIHLPLDKGTKNLVNEDFLYRMRCGSLLVNVSRGGIVENNALIKALKNGWIDAAALDVVEGEPSPPKQLIMRPDVIATPHIAFSSDESILELRERAAQEVVRVLSGKEPKHPCN